MLPVNSSGYSAYQNFVALNPYKYYPDSDFFLVPPSIGTFYDFLETHFSLKSFLPDFHINKCVLNPVHDAMTYYTYCRKNNIQPFIDLNEKRGIHEKYMDDFTIKKDKILICKAGQKMNHNDSETSRCPLTYRKYECSCENPCFDSI